MCVYKIETVAKGNKSGAMEKAHTRQRAGIGKDRNGEELAKEKRVILMITKGN